MYIGVLGYVQRCVMVD